MISLRQLFLNFGVYAAVGCSIASISFAHVTAHLYEGKAKIVTLHPKNYRSEVQRLISEGYDVAGVDLDAETVDIVLSESEFAKFSAKNASSVRSVKDIDTKAAPDSRYTNYEKLTASLKDYAARYPEIVSLQSFGKSLEGRDLWAVKISDNVADHETDEPTVFFNGMHHAREVMTAEVGLDLVETLTSGYSSNNPRIKNWVDNTEIWVVPMINPDGNNKVWTSNNMWRKNSRGGYGVDINRNYPYKWAACDGSSDSRSAQDYHGPSAASEPETQAVMDFVARIKPVMSISYHSYSEMVIYPLGCDKEHVPSPDRETVELVGKQLASRLPKDGSSGTYRYGTPWELLYPVDGGDIDWFYNEHDVLPYVIEINSTAQGFQPNFSWRQKTVEKMRAGWGYFLDRVGQSGIRGIVRNSRGDAVTKGEILVESLADSSFTGAKSSKTYRIKPDGTFHVVLEPGMYKLHISSQDRNEEIDVTVGATRVDLPITL